MVVIYFSFNFELLCLELSHIVRLGPKQVSSINSHCSRRVELQAIATRPHNGSVPSSTQVCQDAVSQSPELSAQLHSCHCCGTLRSGVPVGWRQALAQGLEAVGRCWKLTLAW